MKEKIKNKVGKLKCSICKKEIERNADFEKYINADFEKYIAEKCDIPKDWEEICETCYEKIKSNLLLNKNKTL